MYVPFGRQQSGTDICFYYCLLRYYRHSAYKYKKCSSVYLYAAEYIIENTLLLFILFEKDKKKVTGVVCE